MPPRPRRALLAPALLLCSAVAATAAIRQEAGDDLARELPRIPPVEPADAPATFQVQHGFRLDPVAVEPSPALRSVALVPGREVSTGTSRRGRFGCFGFGGCASRAALLLYCSARVAMVES